MTFRGRSEKYYKIRINKTKGRERYGTFNRDSVRRAELRDSVYDPDIRRNTGKRVGRSYLDHHGGNRRTLYHICPKLERRKSGKGSAFIGIRNRKRTGKLFKYSKYYSGKDPLFVEDDVFRIIVPLDDAYSFDYGIEAGSSKVIESNNADKMPINADKMPINAGKTLVNSLSAQQNSIIQFAKETGSIKSRQVEELLGVKQRRARRILGELVNMGILERQGAYKSTVYVLKN